MIPIAKNIESFPTPFMRALKANKYSKGHSLFSVTQLIGPPQRTYLALTNEKTESAYGLFHALMGTAIHNILEEHVDTANGEVAEERLHWLYTIGIHEIPISGQMDFYEQKCVFDYKNTAGFQDKMKEEHYQQVQMNGYLAKINGYEVEHVGVVYLQRDWSYMRAQVDPTYPQSPFTIYIHPFDEAYGKNQFDTTVPDHWAAHNGTPRPCTPKEQWEKPAVFALMSPGAKRASKLCDTRAEAEELKKPNQIIEERKGDKVFCNSFCGFKHCCPQYQRENQLE
jgi:hypothetical protein